MLSVIGERRPAGLVPAAPDAHRGTPQRNRIPLAGVACTGVLTAPREPGADQPIRAILAGRSAARPGRGDARCGNNIRCGGPCGGQWDGAARSEVRRVGKEYYITCRSGLSPVNSKKKKTYTTHQ